MHNRLKVLLVDDDEDYLILVRSYLSQIELYDYDLIWAKSPGAALECMATRSIDVCLLDYKLGMEDGLELLERIRSAGYAVPIIILTGAGAHDVDLKAMELGADDYLSKNSISPEALERSIRYAIRHKQIEDALRRASERLEERVQERTLELARANEALESEVRRHEATGAALREREEWYRLLFNRAVDALLVFRLSPDATPSRLLDVNDVACKKLRYPRHELLGLSLLDLESSQGEGSLTSRLEDLFELPHLLFETTLVTSDKTEIPFEVHAHLFELRGEPTVLCIFRDITERKDLEQKLRQAQKMEAIGTLAGGIAHDFNNILAAILGYTEMALDFAPPSTPVRKDLEQVLKASLRAKDLVKQILLFSRQRNGQEQRALDLDAIIQDSLRFLRASLPSTIEIRYSVHCRPCIALVDQTQIHQVIINLCTNAAHAMKESGGVLDVSLRAARFSGPSDLPSPEAKPGAYLQLRVSDTGHGMSASTKERIFDPYFTTKKVGEGSGLGLSVVLGIIRNHGGAIAMQSEPEKGTVFDVFLPSLPESEKPASPASGSSLNGKETILFIDDEEPLVDLALRMLEPLGYRVVAKSDSLEALRAFREQPQNYDLVLTDLTMPFMTGLDLAKAIKLIRPDLPIILCSGFDHTVTEDILESTGIREVMTKPLTKSALLDAIRRALDGAGSGTSNRDARSLST